jgi:transglutaminase-like putative cysteine protease
MIIQIPDQQPIIPDAEPAQVSFSLTMHDGPFSRTIPVALIPPIVNKPVPIIYPEKFNDKLWPYSGDCSYQGFIGACDPQKYIIRDDLVVKYAASFLNVTIYGALEWQIQNPFKLHGIFYNNYISDNEKFKDKPEEDYWINPDHYLLNNMSGDCEDAAFAVASILESKGIKTKIVGGYLTYNHQRLRDWIVEYNINKTYYRYFGDGHDFGFIQRGNFELDKTAHGVDFEPVLMFDGRTYYQDYYRDW